MKVYHNGYEYYSKQLFSEYVKDLIYNKIGLTNSVKNTKYFNELDTLLMRHPQYKEKTEGMIDYIITLNDLNRKAFEVRVKTLKGLEAISWRMAINA